MTRQQIYSEVDAERDRQDAKWGIQDMPSVFTPEQKSDWAPFLQNLPNTKYYGLLRASEAREFCDSAYNHGRCTHAHVAVEELAEVLESDNDTDRREELIQCIAVLVKWVENIDRRNNG